MDPRIGSLVASLLPNEPTLQFGPGGIGEGITSTDRGAGTHLVRSRHGHDGRVVRRGLLGGPMVAACAWGGGEADPVELAGRECSTCALRRSPTTCRSCRRYPRFVSCNTALQVGLDGAVNVKRVGRRTIAAIGGRADFCVGASRSIGGFSVIAVRSTATDGASTIVHPSTSCRPPGPMSRSS